MHYKHAITRTPPQTMADGITTQQESVDVLKAQQQHQAYISKLQELDVNVITLPSDHAYPDSHFVEDTTIIYNDVAILTHPGAIARRGEVASIKPFLLQHLTVQELGADEEVLVDGGDVLFAGNRVLIGIYDRTNLRGAQRLKSILHEINSNLEIHFIEFSGVLHLKSGLTALTDNLLIGNPLLKLHSPINFIDIDWLPQHEGYAANTLTVNGSTFYFAESTAAHDIIKKAGNKPIPFELSEFKKMDGSFTCLSLLW